MSWKSIVSADDLEAPTVSATCVQALVATGTTATFGSIVVNG